MWVGYAMAAGAQLFAYFHIVKNSVPKAVLALFIPGYLLYYVWQSEDKMPRLLRIWIIGGLMFVTGTIGVMLVSGV